MKPRHEFPNNKAWQHKYRSSKCVLLEKRICHIIKLAGTLHQGIQQVCSIKLFLVNMLQQNKGSLSTDGHGRCRNFPEIDSVVCSISNQLVHPSATGAGLINVLQYCIFDQSTMTRYTNNAGLRRQNILQETPK
jgi:hypothetical protein